MTKAETRRSKQRVNEEREILRDIRLAGHQADDLLMDEEHIGKPWKGKDFQEVRKNFEGMAAKHITCKRHRDAKKAMGVDHWV